MKLINAFVLGFALTLIAACGGNNPLVGKWKLDGVNIDKAVQSFPAEQREFAKTMMKSAFEQVKGKMILTFEKEGKFMVESPGEGGKKNVENGKWTLSSDKKKLTTDVGGRKETISVIENTDKRLVLGMAAQGQEMEMTFVH
jgi:phosphopentomutase